MISIPLRWKILTVTLSACAISACGVDPSAPLPEVGGSTSADQARSFERHLPLMCAVDSCSGGGFYPTPTPTPTATPTPPPIVNAVKDVRFCAQGGLCPSPGPGFTDQGGLSYDGADHRLFQLYGSLASGASYVSDIKTNYRFLSQPVSTFPGFTLLRSQCEVGFFFFDCVDVYAKVQTYLSGPISGKIVNASLCIRAGSAAWDSPDCAIPAAVLGGTVQRISPTGYNQCIGDDANGDPHCYNFFVETLP